MNFRKELNKIKKSKITKKQIDYKSEEEFINNLLKDVLKYLNLQIPTKNKKIILGFGFDGENIYFRTIKKDGKLEYVSQSIKQYRCSESTKACIILQQLADQFKKECFYVDIRTDCYFEVEIYL